MSDEIGKKSKALLEGLVKDVEDKMPVIDKIKQMAALAKEIGEDTKEIDEVLETAESFGKMVIRRFGKNLKKE